MLERYATRLPAVEVNSSFHRPHRRTTWERWAATTPPRFRFAAKLPKIITISGGWSVAEPLERFLGKRAGWGRSWRY